MGKLLKNSARPTTGKQDPYSQRLNSSLDSKYGEAAAPARNFVTSPSPLTGKKPAQSLKFSWRSPIVSRKPRRDGILQAWAWGAVDMGEQTASLPSGGAYSGAVRSTNFQTSLVQLQDWSQNLKWYICYPMAGAVFQGSKDIRYTYPSFRTPQPQVRLSGGPGSVNVRMQARPRFSAVQRVRQYNTAPRYYSTQSANTANVKSDSSSNVNTPGVKKHG